MAGLQRTSSRVPQVLFVCVHNAGRSQMAAALFNALAGGRAFATSAGTQPGERVHPTVAAVMHEVDLDVSRAKPRLLTMDMLDQADRVITMGCSVEEACPAALVDAEDWGLPDPKGQPVEEVRAVRRMIEERVQRLLSELETDGTETQGKALG